MNAVKELIPHREPFLFVDEIVSANRDEIIGVKNFGESFTFAEGHFPGGRIVPGVLLVEAMGQCGGAGIKQLGLGGDALYGFAAFENVRFLGAVKLGKTVKMVIKNLKISNRAIKQSGTAYCDGKAVAEATWLCVRLE